METKYLNWISEHVPNAYGKCSEVTLSMVNAFPELRRVRGWYYCIIWGERMHWWCVAPNGEIIDPTAEQFPSKGSGVYVEHEEGQPLPTGKCPNCGEYCYNYDPICSEHCEIEYISFLKQSV